MKSPVRLLILLGSCFILATQAQLSAAQQPSAKKLRIVVFGAHCDDNETGAGRLSRSSLRKRVGGKSQIPMLPAASRLPAEELDVCLWC